MLPSFLENLRFLSIIVQTVIIKKSLPVNREAFNNPVGAKLLMRPALLTIRPASIPLSRCIGQLTKAVSKGQRSNLRIQKVVVGGSRARDIGDGTTRTK